VIFRKLGLFTVMLGAMALSFHGQVETIAPAAGLQMAVVFAVTMDIASLLGLHELMTSTRREVRAWAWAVLLLAGGTALLLNTWYTLRTGALPWGFAVVAGVVPVALAGVLSHLFALSVAAHDGDTTTPATQSEHTPARPAPAPRPPVPQQRPAPTSPRHTATARKPAVKPAGTTEITDDLLRAAAQLDATAPRGRAGYRTIKDGLDISEPTARKVRAALDEQQAGGQVIPMHRPAEDPAPPPAADRARPPAPTALHAPRAEAIGTQ
jgi:hypothetical protein